MILPVLRAGWLLLGVGLASTFVVALTTDVTASEHDRYWHAVREARELDARLNEEIAKSRLGIVTHYDALVRTDDQIRGVGAELARVPEYVSEEDRSLIEQRRLLYREVVVEKRKLVERFKSEQAILRNSLRAFPHNADRLLAATGEDPSSAALRAAVRALEHDVMLLALSPSEQTLARATCSMWPLGQEGSAPRGCDASPVSVPDEVEREVGMVLSHARMVMDRQESTERLVGDIMTLPVSARAMELADTYDAAYEAARQGSRTRWSIVAALAAGLLLIGASYIIVKLQTSAAALRETTGQLGEALAALEHERDREKELAELKSRFVSMTSHEFRTPLSVILSSSEMLEAYGHKWPQEKRDLHLGRVQSAAKDMSRMLDGVLLIGRAEAGMLHLNAQPLRLGELCEGIVDEIRAVVGSGRQLAFVDRTPEEEVCLDEKLVRHVLLNLLSNAFKYSSDDSVVRFEVSCTAESAVFEVSDEGIGIPPEDRERLFDAFHRCSNVSGIPGSGLGLAVVKKSLDVHGGTVDIDSTVGEGTRFTVRIPFEEGEA